MPICRLASFTAAGSVYVANPTDPLSVGQQLTDVPKSLASAALTYQNTQGWRVSMDALSVSATSWTSADHTDPGFPYQAAADPHVVVDAAASVPLSASLETYLQIQNLLNRRYIVNPGPYNPPQTGTPFQAFIGVRIKLK